MPIWPSPGMTPGQVTMAVVRWLPAPRDIDGTVLVYPQRPPLNDLLVIRQTRKTSSPVKERTAR